jgi:hypothetical protein
MIPPNHFPTNNNIPLAFDVTAGPSESTPLTKVKPGSLGVNFAATATAFVSAYGAFWHDVNNTMRSTTDFSSGGDAFRPCSNTSSACCRLYHQPAGARLATSFSIAQAKAGSALASVCGKVQQQQLPSPIFQCIFYIDSSTALAVVALPANNNIIFYIEV